MVMTVFESHGPAAPGEKTAQVATSPSLVFSQPSAASTFRGSHHSRGVSESLQLAPPTAPPCPVLLPLCPFLGDSQKSSPSCLPPTPQVVSGA